MGRAFVDEQPRTFKALGDHLLTRWPERDRFGLEQAVRTGVPLVQVPPRGLWGRSGPIAHTSIEAWLGEPPDGAADHRYGRDALPGRVRAGQRHGRPGVVRPDQARRGLRAPSAGARHVPRRARPRAVRPAGRAPTRSRDAGPAAVPVRLREHAAVVRRPVAGDRPRDRPRDRYAHPGIAEHVHARRVRGRDVGRQARARGGDARRSRPWRRCRRPTRARSPTRAPGSLASSPPRRPTATSASPTPRM